MHDAGEVVANAVAGEFGSVGDGEKVVALWVNIVVVDGDEVVTV